MTSFLYYAGMAADRQTEQIGLAIASDGKPFQRVDGGGLIIRNDPGVSWKSLRVCNPTVIRRPGRWLMFYQGVGPGPTGSPVHAIALAHSEDGQAWVCDPQPLLTFDDCRSALGMTAGAGTGGVIEPAIVESDGQLLMYFIAYVGSYRDGTYLCRAASIDGRAWAIEPGWILASTQFGPFRLHYPQVVAEPDGYSLWFTLIELQGSGAAIFHMRSRDGRHFERLAKILPSGPAASFAGPQEIVSLRLQGRSVRGLSRLNRLIHGAIGDGPYLGYAHPHLDDGRLFYHAYHLNRDGFVWMDIGCCDVRDGRAGRGVSVLAPSADANAWDGFFVADPFVVTL